MHKISIILGEKLTAAITLNESMKQRIHEHVIVEASDNLVFLQSEFTSKYAIIEDVQLNKILPHLSPTKDRVLIILGEASQLNLPCHVITIAKPTQLHSIFQLADLLALHFELPIQQTLANTSVKHIQPIIRYLEHDGNATTYHLLTATLSLPVSTETEPFWVTHFQQINASTFINFDFVRRFDTSSITLKSGEKLIVTAEFRHEAWKAICQYLLPANSLVALF